MFITPHCNPNDKFGNPNPVEIPHPVCATASLSAAAKGVPIWQAHGTMDPLLPLPLAQMSHDFLKGLGLSASFSTCARCMLLRRAVPTLCCRYPMQHSSHPREMADAVAWLQQRLPTALPSEAELRSMSTGDLKRLAASRLGWHAFAACGCFDLA